MQKHVGAILIAIAIAASAGTSAVATAMITSRDIKNGTIKTVDLARPLQEDVVPVIGTISGNAPVDLNGRVYAPMTGAGLSFDLPEQAATLTPDNYISIDNFSAAVQSPLPAGGSVDVRIHVEDRATEFGCTITAPADTCATTQSITIVSKKSASVQLTGSGGEQGALHQVITTWGGRLLNQEG